MKSTSSRNVVRRARLVVLVSLLLGGCAADGPEEDSLEQTEQSLQRFDSAEKVVDVTKSEAPLELERAGVSLRKSYVVDELGAIETKSGEKLTLAPSDLYQPDAQSQARLATGTGPVGGTGGLNAWGCWTGSCCRAGHYTQCAIGWCWVCDLREPCTRCIWPY